MWSVIYRQSSLATQLSDSKATAAVTAAAAAATTRAKRTHSETTLAEASEKADSRAEPRCATTCPRNCNQATNAVAVGEFSAATSAAAGETERDLSSLIGAAKAAKVAIHNTSLLITSQPIFYLPRLLSITTPPNYLLPSTTFLLYRFIGWLDQNPQPFLHWTFLDMNFLKKEWSAFSYHRFHLKKKLEGERECVCVCVCNVCV
jgi:hypothetical protein